MATRPFVVTFMRLYDLETACTFTCVFQLLEEMSWSIAGLLDDA